MTAEDEKLVAGFDAVDLEMIRRGDMLGPRLGRRTYDALTTLSTEVQELRAALRPFAATKMPSLRRTERDYDEFGLRRMMSPMEIAVKRARAALKPERVE